MTPVGAGTNDLDITRAEWCSMVMIVFLRLPIGTFVKALPELSAFLFQFIPSAKLWSHVNYSCPYLSKVQTTYYERAHPVQHWDHEEAPTNHIACTAKRLNGQMTADRDEAYSSFLDFLSLSSFHLSVKCWTISRTEGPTNVI
jgi:hypothetical protein